MPSPTSCPECGATQAPGATRCDLCGSALVPSGEDDAAPESEAPVEPASPPLATSESASMEPESTAPAFGPSYCTQCGHPNPADARFCNRCGSALPRPEVASASSSATPTTSALATPVAPSDVPPIERTDERPSSEPGMQAIKLVGIALVAVLGLYVVTQWSKSRDTPPAETPEAVTPASPQQAAAPSVALPDSLRDRIALLEDEGTAASWAEAGRLLFQASLSAPDDATRAGYAQRAVDAFEQSLAQQDDLDVRTNLAAAALYDPRNPMRAVQELQQVLTEDPDHVEANFNMGLLRMQIGRLDGAAEAFRVVIAGTDPSAPVHQEARRALEAVEQQRASDGAANG